MQNCAIVGAGSVCKLLSFNLPTPNRMQNDHEWDLERAVVAYFKGRDSRKSWKKSPKYSPQYGQTWGQLTINKIVLDTA